MKKLIGIAVACGALLSSWATPQAHAQTAAPAAEIAAGGETGHAFGIGFMQTPWGLNAAEAEIYVGQSLMIDVLAGFSLYSPDGGDMRVGFGLGGGVFYRWKVWDPVALMIGGRLSFAFLNQYVTGGEAGESTVDINLEMPLRAEIYFARYLSVHAEVAGVLGIVTSGPAKGVYFGVPLTNLIAGFGATFYFN